MRATFRRLVDCGLDGLKISFGLSGLLGESRTILGKRVDCSNPPAKSFNRVSQTLGRVVKTFKRVSILSNRMANLFNAPVKSSGGLAQTSNRVPYNFNARV